MRCWLSDTIYRQSSNIRRKLASNSIADHSDVVGASPADAFPTITSLPTWHLASIDCTKTTARRDEKYLNFGNWCALYWRFYGALDVSRLNIIRYWTRYEREKAKTLFRLYTETEKSSFWWNVHHWLHWKLSKWQLPVQPVMKISSKWRHFCFSVCTHKRHTIHPTYHDDVIKRKHFPRYWPFVRGIHRIWYIFNYDLIELCYRLSSWK